MTKTWQLQEAKNKLSEVVDEALRNGPQVITRRGAEAVVVVAASEYRALLQQQQPLSKFFRESPLAYGELDLTRDASPPRDEAEL